MADRSVSVELRAKVAQYLAGIQAAKQATKDLSAETFKATKQNHANMQQVGKAGLIAGGAIAAGFGLAVRAAANFDKALSGVRAVANGTAAEMAQLRQAALDAGAATVFSASEAAQAEAELAKAGISVADILGGALAGSLDLAAAGQLELADAATIAAQAMNIFKLEGSDVTHVADVLASGANKSAADVKQLGDALRQGGLVAAQSGASFEETVGALAAFADNALIGSDAGTALKTMFQRLTPDSEKAAGAMQDIGLKAFDAQGNFVGLEAVAGQLQKGLGTLTAEQRATTLEIIFGADAVRGANVLYEQGAHGIADYNKAMNDQGAAARMASIQLDNLSGDLEALQGSIETALIQTGSGGNDALRGLTQTATGAVNAFSGLPGPVQTTVTGIAGVTGVALLAAGAFGTMAPRVRETRDALNQMGRAGALADRNLGRLGKLGAIGAVVATVGVSIGYLSDQLIKLQGNAPPAVNDLTLALLDLADTGKLSGTAIDSVGKNASQLVDDLEQMNSLGGDINKWASKTSFGLVGPDWKEASNRVKTLDAALASLVRQGAADQAAAAFDRLSVKVLAAGGSIPELNAALPGYAAALQSADLQARAAGDSTGGVADALSEVSPAAEDAAQALKDYTDALADTAAIDAYTATAELAESFKDLSKEIKTAGKVTNDEKVTLGGFARDVRSTAGAILEQSGSQAKANQAMQDGRKQFIDLAIQAGYSADAAKRLADRLLEIPARTDIEINAQGIDDALAKTRELVRLLTSKGIDAGVAQGTANKLGTQGYAAGGIIPGPPSRSDTVPAWLSTGEFVVNAAATAANRGLLDAINSGHRFADGGIVAGASYSSHTTSSGPTWAPTYQIQTTDPRRAAMESTQHLKTMVFQRDGVVV